MRPEELLRLANLLAADAGGSPRWVARNRAVSTAYYALFHALCAFCGRQLVGARRPWAAYKLIYRSLDHAQARRVLDAARRDPSFNEAIKFIGDVFTDLQEARHAADYDPDYRIASADLGWVLSDVELATRLLSDLPSPDRKLPAARLVGRSRG